MAVGPGSSEPSTAAPDRGSLQALQLQRLREVLARLGPRNRFYTAKLAAAHCTAADLHTLTDLARFPLTTKAELSADQAAQPPYGTALSEPLENYCRLHQTSGTSGRPLYWLDTPSDWGWMLACWQRIFEVIGIQATDRLFFPFSFGPFLGFWTAFEAAAARGLFCLPAGGMSSSARVRQLLEHAATVVLCTPTYALRLAEVAQEERLDLARSAVRMVIVAGEPGGSILPTRQRIEAAWGARVFDHSGMTEIGPAAIECPANPAGLHILEEHYIAEVLEPQGTQPVPPGQVGELVLTNLGRFGSPLVRYRTGDLVCVDPAPCPCGRPWIRLAGGILGRVDDMIHFRGNNLYPGNLEAVLRRFPEVVEYRIEIARAASLPTLRVEVEPHPHASVAGLAERIEQAFRTEFLFGADVRLAAPGSLPRFELKARRIHFQGTGDTK